MKEPSFILRYVCLTFLIFYLEHTKSFPTSEPLHTHFPLPGTLIALSTSSSFSPSVPQFHCPFHGEAFPDHATGMQPPLLTSILAPCFSSNPFLEPALINRLVSCQSPTQLLSPIRARAIPVLFAIKQPLLSTAFGAHTLSINAYPIIE